jgi:uncharacterized protein YraI
MKRLRIAMLVLAGLLFASLTPSMASAANGYVTKTTKERAGPSTKYPVVAVIPRGAPVTIFGCVKGWSWCDVSWMGNRGWVPAANLEGYWNGRRYGYSYFGRFGIPIIIFDFGPYWGYHYKNKPWYKGWPGGPGPHPGPHGPMPPWCKPGKICIY